MDRQRPFNFNYVNFLVPVTVSPNGFLTDVPQRCSSWSLTGQVQILFEAGVDTPSAISPEYR